MRLLASRFDGRERCFRGGIGLIHYGLPTSADPMRATYDSILGVGDLNNVTQTLPVPAN
jgi:hypothetical protein